MAAGVRNFAYGLISVDIGVAWREAGFSPALIGALFSVALFAGGLTGALAGLVSHRIGRRRLMWGLGLVMAAGGGLLTVHDTFAVAAAVAALGAFSPSGKDVGAMLPLDQAALAETATGDEHTRIYAAYNLLTTSAAALGALAVAGLGLLPRWGPLAGASRFATALYAVCGVLVALSYTRLSPGVEGGSRREGGAWTRLRRSRPVVFRLTALFGVDALAGGLVVQGIMVVWFHDRFGVGLATLGPLLFVVNMAAAASFLAAAPLARRFGILPTMVFTHLPSNILLVLVALAPSFPLAAALLVARSLLSQLDVPTRQAYTMAVVDPEERTAAAGVTSAVRGPAAAISPSLAGIALARSALGIPFILAGVIKVGYDLSLWTMFRRVRLPASAGSARDPS